MLNHGWRLIGSVGIMNGWKFHYWENAEVAELADALDLGSSGATRGSSSLPFRTKFSPAADPGVVCL